jgi:hypothetical protein
MQCWVCVFVFILSYLGLILLIGDCRVVCSAVRHVRIAIDALSSLAYALSIASTALALVLAAKYVGRSTPPTSAPAATTAMVQQQVAKVQ